MEKICTDTRDVLELPFINTLVCMFREQLWRTDQWVLRLTSSTTASSEDKLWLLGRSIVPFVSRTVTWNDPEPAKTSVKIKSLATVTVMAATVQWTEIAPIIEIFLAALRKVAVVRGAEMVVGMQQSCGHIIDVLTLTGGEDDGEVDHHTPRGKASDVNSHPAGIHHGLHLWGESLVDLLATKAKAQNNDSEVFVGLAAGVVQISSEPNVGESRCGVESLSVYKGQMYLVLFPAYQSAVHVTSGLCDDLIPGVG
ncbi:hypothetical protein EYF80_012791 [Liparis tanakae]|uniref:Uncharacterized protein n=1 Tax=Liparis tanakae TaxID=230148 RepID=A0A4Z2IGX7_9TELE|nr:hypothetical protein EYF80_012791 [Liparis tanakae]